MFVNRPSHTWIGARSNCSSPLPLPPFLLRTCSWPGLPRDGGQFPCASIQVYCARQIASRVPLIPTLLVGWLLGLSPNPPAAQHREASWTWEKRDGPGALGWVAMHASWGGRFGAAPGHEAPALKVTQAEPRGAIPANGHSRMARVRPMSPVIGRL